MGKYEKWIGAGLGWAFGGPIGAAIGFGVGSLFSTSERKQTYTETKNTGRNDFITALLVLSASVMKADGKIMKSELDFVKTFLKDNFGQDTATEATSILKDLLYRQVPLKEVCMQINANTQYQARVQLLHYMFGIAQSDGHTCEAEVNKIEEIASYLNINTSDFSSIKAMFYKDINYAYRILGIDNKATVTEIKKAYRKMAIEHHPDKLEHLGEDIRKGAEEKFREINTAYEQLKKERQFN
ncbi:MAG: TerB family tellurite resistance protein [Marinifilaceae bacterium]